MLENHSILEKERKKEKEQTKKQPNFASHRARLLPQCEVELRDNRNYFQFRYCVIKLPLSLVKPELKI